MPSSNLLDSTEMTALLQDQHSSPTPIHPINWDRIKEADNYIQRGYLDYTLTRAHSAVRFSTLALVVGLFVGYSYLNFQVCNIFWALASQGAHLLPGSRAINQATAGPSGFIINFILNQFFALNAYKLLFNIVTYRVVVEKLDRHKQRSLNWERAKLPMSLAVIFTIAIFASVIMVALGDTALRSTQLDLYSGIVFLVQNLLGGLDLKTWLLGIPTSLKGMHFTFSAYERYIIGYLAEQIRLFFQQSYYLAFADKSEGTPKHLLPKDTRTEEEKFFDAFDKTKKDYFDTDNNIYWTDSFQDNELPIHWENNFHAIKGETKITWENSHSRTALILLIKLVCQVATAWSTVFLIWNGADFLQKSLGIPSAFYLKWITSGVVFSPFVKLSYDLVNSSVNGLYQLFETIVQQFYAIVTGQPSQKNQFFPSNPTWKKVIYRSALATSALAIMIGIFAAWQSSGTGIELTSQYGFNGWLLNLLPNLLSHINFNAEGNSQMVLTLLGLLGNYLYSASEKRENVSYCGYNGLGDTGIFSSKMDKLGDFVKREKLYKQESNQTTLLVY